MLSNAQNVVQCESYLTLCYVFIHTYITAFFLSFENRGKGTK